ncbi:protein elav-like [Chelonus insularis]|uniref:protein elav-like n=1 Tax=Chelonus insularis TaxID=460826 RepID=UPI00158CE12A|nr:protein elav-like [Chelonus insularis]
MPEEEQQEIQQIEEIKVIQVENKQQETKSEEGMQQQEEVQQEQVQQQVILTRQENVIEEDENIERPGGLYIRLVLRQEGRPDLVWLYKTHKF